MSDENKFDLNAAIQSLSNHFEKQKITAKEVDNVLSAQGTVPPGTVKQIIDNDLMVHFKYGVYQTPHGRDFYALPCELDKASFLDDVSYNAVRKQLENLEIEIHDMDMLYLETGLLRKWSFEEAKWKSAQNEVKITNEQNFSYLPREEFFEKFAADLDFHAKKKNKDVTEYIQGIDPE